MSFEPLQPVRTKKTDDGTGISAGLVKRGARPARLYIYLRRNALDLLDFERGSHARVAIGTGADAGKVRISQVARGGRGAFPLAWRQVGKQVFAALDLGALPGLPNVAVGSEWCDWRLAEAGVAEIVLPDFAAQPGPARRPVTASDRTRHTDVPRRAACRTGALMGDPAPGRSALDQRKGEIG